MDRQHLKFLDGIRAACAMVVVAHHAWLEVWPVGMGKHPVGLTAAMTGWLLYARFAVDVFIILSGFCLMLPVAGTDGTIRGAGLDVYEAEPRIPAALLTMENVVLLPHLGSATDETRTAMGMKAFDNIVAFFKGHEPADRVA